MWWDSNEEDSREVAVEREGSIDIDILSCFGPPEGLGRLELRRCVRLGRYLARWTYHLGQVVDLEGCVLGRRARLGGFATSEREWVAICLVSCPSTS